MMESFAELFEESQVKTKFQHGAVIAATVVAIQAEWVIVNSGLKSESKIPREEFLDAQGQIEVAVGDLVDVALETMEDGTGETKLSRERVKRNATWAYLDQAHQKNENIQGTITGKVKGGFTVEINEIRAFLPGSLVDLRPVRDTLHLEGRPIDFKVIKLDRKRNNVVVSRKAVLESEFSAEREALLGSLEEGMVVRGAVKNLTDYGAFVDLGGIDGLLHITDMAWRRVKHPSEVVTIGQELEVRILKFDRERNRVSLGLKQIGDDPWLGLARRYPQSKRIFGHITNITDYGCFVEIEPGVEGLVHVSEMDWTNKNVNPAKVVHLNDEVEVMILDIDEDRRRISLGMKQCRVNPWDEFAANFNKGDKVSGKIKSITDFGIFIGLDGGIDGLVHLSDISWSATGEEAIRKYKKGDELDAVVLAVDPERERISLGIKQLERDPFTAFLADHPKGSVVKGVVKEVDAKGATLTLDEGVEGYLRVSEMARERVEDAAKLFKPGDVVEAKFIAVDRKSHTVMLSIKAKDIQEEEVVMQDYSRQAPTTIGDLLRHRLEQDQKGG